MTQESTLEKVLSEDSEGQASEEQVETTDKVEETEVEKVEDETPEAFESRVQTEADKRANTYREKREADTALIRSLQSQIKELKTEGNSKRVSKLMDSIIAGDEEEGVEEDKIEAKSKSFKELKELIKGYDQKSAEIEETAEFVSKMIEGLPPKIIKEFGLDDANPNIRASGGVKLLDEAVAVISHNQNFLLALEHFLPKGDELRKELEDIVEGLAEFESEKSKILYLKDRLRGVKVARKKLPAPSESLGGTDLSRLSPKEKIERGLENMKRK